MPNMRRLNKSWAKHQPAKGTCHILQSARGTDRARFWQVGRKVRPHPDSLRGSQAVRSHTPLAWRRGKEHRRTLHRLREAPSYIPELGPGHQQQVAKQEGGRGGPFLCSPGNEGVIYTHTPSRGGTRAASQLAKLTVLVAEGVNLGKGHPSVNYGEYKIRNEKSSTALCQGLAIKHTQHLMGGGGLG